MAETHTFTSTLTKLQAWTIAPLPKSFVIEAVQPFGRTPVIATLNGKEWKTSLWTERSGETMIAVPKKVRGKLEEGDEVEISFVYDYERF
ncbi:DUF1905 domain-containing protein [Sulfurovum sp.]|uniref:DUF1905 domain-containing protein n=1 Tax=Sulfurovum sp. TaxID=1969726 RepID=UPI0025FF0F1E|nr:DUF1905 domain-containing protein [Sulfurovum sp.]